MDSRAQNNSAVADAAVYDPRTNRWSAIAPLPRPLGSVSVAVLGNEIHLAGGRDAHSVRTHLVYDPATNRYSERAPLPVGRDHMGLVGFEGKLYAIGGRIDTPAHNTSYVDVYDPRANGWTSGARVPTARSGMAVAAYERENFCDRRRAERNGGCIHDKRGVRASDEQLVGIRAAAPRSARYRRRDRQRASLRACRRTGSRRQPPKQHALRLHDLDDAAPHRHRRLLG